MDNLPLLKDIHLPDEMWFFPLGYGWCLIVAFPIVIYFFYRMFRYLQAKSKKYYALKLLSNIEENDLYSAAKISEILRRICLFKYKNAVSLYGNDWILFLNKHCKKQLTGQVAELLIYAPYMQSNHQKYDKQTYRNLRNFAKAWIGENL